MKVALFALFVALATAAEIKLHSEDGIEGEYIVVLKSNTTSEARDALIAKLAHSEIKHRYNIGGNFIGFAARLHPADLKGLTIHPLVDYIEQNMKVYAYRTCNSQGAAPWGLARTSSSLESLQTARAALDRFDYTPEANGKAVRAYIIDTGVRITHNDFGGRATFGFKADNSWSDQDMNGHGTHVAGTVGGDTYGVAKDCSLIAVKVLGDDGTGTLDGVIAGIDWAASDCGTNNCVANLSLGGGYSAAMNAAATGGSTILTMVVAAGNNNRDSSGYSPASADGVITVASAAEEPDYKVSRSSFSNFGEDVDIFAPGSAITSAWINSDTDYNTISGTSMASPHVAGVAVQLRSNGVSLEGVWDQLFTMSEKNMVDNSCSFIGRKACENTPTDFLKSVVC